MRQYRQCTYSKAWQVVSTEYMLTEVVALKVLRGVLNPFKYSMD